MPLLSSFIIKQKVHLVRILITLRNNLTRKRIYNQLAHIPITYKLLLVIGALVTSGMVLLGLFIVNNQTELLRNQTDEFGQTVVHQLAESSKELVLSDDMLSLMVQVSNLGASENILGVVVYAESGKVLASSGILPNRDILNIYNVADQSNKNFYKYNWTLTDNGSVTNVVSFITPIKYRNLMTGHALVTFSHYSLSQAILKTVNAITTATILILGLAIYITYLLSKRISRPIHDLMDASKAIDSGDLSYRIHEQRHDELGYLMDAFNKMAHGMLEKSQVENAFSRFVAPKIAKQIMANLDHIQLGGKHVEATVMFADIVGFTSMSEKQPPAQVAALLNEYFAYISTASRLYNGTIDKYMGDCAMIVFGIPEYDPDHKYNAVACSIMIQRLIGRLNELRSHQNKVSVQFRIGINSGPMLAGNLGSPDRMQYSVVGDAVNLASRLHSLADSGQIVVTDRFVKDSDVQWNIQAHQHKSITLRGFADPVTTYIITDLKHIDSAAIDAQIEELLANKIVA